MKKREKWGNISASLDSQNAREKDTKPFPASDSWDNAWKSMEKNSKAKRKTTMCRESLTQRVNPLGPVTFLNIREQLAGESSPLFFFNHFSLRVVSTTGQHLFKGLTGYQAKKCLLWVTHSLRSWAPWYRTLTVIVVANLSVNVVSGSCYYIIWKVIDLDAIPFHAKCGRPDWCTKPFGR